MSRGCRRRLPPSGCGSVSPGSPAPRASPISSTIPLFTIGLVTPMRARTVAIGPTIIAALDCSAGSRQSWRAAPIRAGAPTSCTVTTGTPGSLPPTSPPARRQKDTFRRYSQSTTSPIGAVSRRDFPRLGIATRILLDRRGRVFWYGVVHQGWSVLLGPPDYGEPDLRARDPDTGLWLGPRRVVAHSRQCVDWNLERRRSALLGSPAR